VEKTSFNSFGRPKTCMNAFQFMTTMWGLAVNDITLRPVKWEATNVTTTNNKTQLRSNMLKIRLLGRN
jgi:hypothetical protein